MHRDIGHKLSFPHCDAGGVLHHVMICYARLHVFTRSLSFQILRVPANWSIGRNRMRRAFPRNRCLEPCVRKQEIIPRFQNWDKFWLFEEKGVLRTTEYSQYTNTRSIATCPNPWSSVLFPLHWIIISSWLTPSLGRIVIQINTACCMFAHINCGFTSYRS